MTLWSKVAALLIGAYAIVDAKLFYVDALHRVAFGLVVAGSAIAAASGGGLAWKHAPVRWMTTAWAVLSTVALFPAIVGLAESTRDPLHVAGDFASSSLPLILLVAGFRDAGLFGSRWALIALVASHALASSVSVLDSSQALGRHEAPVVFSIVACWTVYSRTSDRAVWNSMMLLLGLFLLVAVSSGYRSSLLLWPVTGMLVYVFANGPRRVLALAAAGTAGVVIFALANPGGYLDSLRLGELISDHEDPSLETRLREAQDVLRVARDEWGPAQWVFGAGHGASLTPEHADPNPRNLDAEGRIHTVHATPVLVFFRYGLVGVAAMVALAALLLRRLFLLARDLRGPAPAPSLPHVLFPLALAAYAADSLVHVALVDPAFSYSLAGFLYFELAGGDAAA